MRICDTVQRIKSIGLAVLGELTTYLVVIVSWMPNRTLWLVRGSLGGIYSVFLRCDRLTMLIVVMRDIVRDLVQASQDAYSRGRLLIRVQLPADCQYCINHK